MRLILLISFSHGVTASKSLVSLTWGGCELNWILRGDGRYLPFFQKYCGMDDVRNAIGVIRDEM